MTTGTRLMYLKLLYNHYFLLSLISAAISPQKDYISLDEAIVNTFSNDEKAIEIYIPLLED